MLEAREFCFESPLVPDSAAGRAYAEPTFGAGRSLVEVIAEVTELISPTSPTTPGSPR